MLLALGATPPLGDVDVQAPLLSLPWIMKISCAEVGANVPYLQADARLLRQWRRELNGMPGFKVGIAWQGRPTFLQDRLRSIPLAEWKPLAEVEGIRLISLQKGPGSEQLRQLDGNFDVIDLGSRLDQTNGAFMDTAAVMKSLDLVITSDTSIAHLAGALGVRVWVALSSVPDWRWMLQWDDSPWYPTMRLFRQASAGDWAEVFDTMATKLAALTERTAMDACWTPQVASAI